MEVLTHHIVMDTMLGVSALSPPHPVLLLLPCMHQALDPTNPEFIERDDYAISAANMDE